MKPAVVSAADTSAWALKVTVPVEPSLTLPPLARLAVGSTLLTVTVTLSVARPPSSSVTRTPMVGVAGPSSNVQSVLGAACGPTSNMPSLSQSNAYSSGSAAPAGSVAVTVTVVGLPSSTGSGEALTSLMTGSRLATVIVNVAESDAPSLSVTVTVTV